MPKFTETIYKVGRNPCVEVPRRVSDDLGKMGYMPIKGTLSGHPFASTLVPVGSGRHRLYINKQMRKEARVAIGDKIEVVLELDDQTQELSMPPVLADAFEKHPKAKARYNSYPPSRKGEILAFLNSLKEPGDLERNVDKLLAVLEEEEV
ncbi:MAG TPA: DUF1905 domain-containing protein [Actinobacteria bacterium]|nr:DUF1905 domain-containing protein [Actinomycetota bacterium]